MSTPRNHPKYAKNSLVGDHVHAKATDVTAEAQCRRWFGSLWKDKWISGELQAINEIKVNNRKQRMFTVIFSLPDMTSKVVELRDIRCRPGIWSDTTGSPAVPLLGMTISTTTDAANSVNNLSEGDSILQVPESQLQESIDLQSINLLEETFPDEPDGTVAEEVVETQQTTEPIPSVVTDTIEWYTDMDAAKEDANGTVAEIKWKFRDRSGRWMSAGDDERQNRPIIDYFLAAFPPRAMRDILSLTNAKLHDADLEQMEIGELIYFLGY